MPKYSDITTSKSIDPNGFARSYENRLVISLLLLLSSFVLSAQCTLSCNNNLNIALNQNGEAIVSAGLLLADPDCNPDDFTVFVFLNGQNIGNILNCNHVGYPLTAQLIHNVSGNYCTSNIQVQDYIAPQIFCSDTIVPCNSTLSPDETGYPLAMDNCTAFSNTDFNYADTYTDLPCNTQVNGTTVTARIDRKWWITDASGLADTCVQIIYQQRATVYDITFPQNLDGLQSPMLDCGQDPSSAELTGYPTVFGKPVVNDDLCELSVTYNDLEIATCGTSSYNIIRTWTAADWCTGQIITHGQIIKVKDTSPPLINCPADMNVSSSTISCGATVLLPQATATDDCSDFSIQVSWQFGTGTGPYYGVPLGTHVVTYTAQDDCGNMSTCQMTVTVVDDIAPVNICKSSLSINISSAGSVTVPASVFDDGSFDNCEIDHFEVKRQGMSFAEFISFDCQDVNASIVPVTFRVFDIYGNFNDCVVNVAVHDYIAPLITCPATVLLSCQDDYSDTTLTGSPTVADNCGIDSLYFTEVEDINDCGVGMVIRTWTVVDLSGNTGTCVQNIILEDNTPVQVSFPVDFSSSVCGIVETGTDVTGIPTIVNDDCELVDYTYTDEIFDISAPACYTILRHWVVIDWCTYVPNSGSLDGYYTHTQVISISDEEAPVLTIPASFTAYSLSANCGSDEVLIPPAIAEDCHPQVQITNDSPYAYANGADASGQYPIGMHQITFVANDGCGNVTTETMTLIVEDGLAPTVVCLSNVSVSLNANGQIQVNPLDLDVSLSDNCTDVSDLVLSLLPNVFDCTDIGTNESILTVEDAAGNTATCVVMIEVQDNQFVCGQSATLSGQLLTPQGAIMEGVEVQIVGADTSSVWTDDTGAFLYDQALVDNGYIVRPYKNTHYMNGVSTLDLLFMNWHILEIAFLDSPYKIIAADVNRSGTVSTFDVVYLKRLILNIDTAFSNNTSWRFVQADYVFPNPSNPFTSAYPESVFIENLTEDRTNIDFVGVKIGDVSGNASGSDWWEAEGRDTPDDLIFEIEDKDLAQGESLEVVFQADTPEDLQAYQFTIQLDTTVLDFVEIVPFDNLEKSHVNENDFGLHQIDKGYITTQWINTRAEKLPARTRFFRLKCLVKKNAQLSEVLTIHSALTAAKVFKGTIQEGFKESGLRLHFLPKKNKTEAFEEELSLYISPNPVLTHCYIWMDLPTATKANYQLMDACGRTWKKEHIVLEKGNNKIYFERNQLPTGIYFLHITLEATGNQIVRKILLQDG